MKAPKHNSKAAPGNASKPVTAGSNRKGMSRYANTSRPARRTSR